MSVLAFYAQFVKSLVGVNSLTVTWDVEQITRSDGTRSALVTGGATSITIGRRGLYGYLLSGADTKLYDYVATAITAGDVDQKEIAALWTMYEADSLKLSGDGTAADNAESFFDGTGYAGTNNVIPTVTTVSGGTINSVLGTVKATDENGAPLATATALAAATATLTVVSAVDGGELAIYQAVSFRATISGLAIPADWTKVYWTVKRATSEADTDAILQLVETNPAADTDGLLRLNGAAGTAANGTLTIDQAAGTVDIDLVMMICDDLALATGLVWSLKALRPSSASALLAIGTVNVLGQATMAVA